MSSNIFRLYLSYVNFFLVKYLVHGAVSKQEFYSILAKNRAKKVPETCSSSKLPELFIGFILEKIYPFPTV